MGLFFPAPPLPAPPRAQPAQESEERGEKRRARRETANATRSGERDERARRARRMSKKNFAHKCILKNGAKKPDPPATQPNPTHFFLLHFGGVWGGFFFGGARQIFKTRGESGFPQNMSPFFCPAISSGAALSKGIPKIWNFGRISKTRRKANESREIPHRLDRSSPFRRFALRQGAGFFRV